MQLASHGYLVVAPDFTDGSAMCATDKDGNNVDISIPKGNQKNKDGTANMDWHNLWRPMFEHRVKECHELGKEIKDKGFSMRELTFNIDIDCEKMIIAGHSYGGWTSILAASGD